VVLWCAHDNPDLRLDRSGEPSGGSADSPLASARRASRPLRPSWNRTVLDRAVRKALTAADPSRPAIPHSGADPQPPRFAPTPRHLWFGWETPLARLATFIGRNANAAQFVSAFGAKSVPAHLDISSASPWPSVDLADFCEPDPETSPEGDLRLLSQWTPLRSHSNDREWALGTQEHQAMVVRNTVETLRRLKYRPAGGFAVSRLTDPGPLVSTSLTDHERAPKLAFVALKKVCAPVIVVADRLPDRVRPNSPVALDVHVVSDLRHRIEHARVDAVVAWDDDDYRTGWSGDIEADACVRVGLVRFVTPAVPGTLTVTLKLTVDGEVLSTFDDRTTIFRP
jgi:beta-mannosidase